MDCSLWSLSIFSRAVVYSLCDYCSIRKPYLYARLGVDFHFRLCLEPYGRLLWLSRLPVRDIPCSAIRLTEFTTGVTAKPCLGCDVILMTSLYLSLTHSAQFCKIVLTSKGVRDLRWEIVYWFRQPMNMQFLTNSIAQQLTNFVRFRFYASIQSGGVEFLNISLIVFYAYYWLRMSDDNRLLPLIAKLPGSEAKLLVHFSASYDFLPIHLCVVISYPADPN
ncbi:hypothetical protein VNO77_14521 [Canavalia gladiata]|uniref:Uncharacterized protein n=1 Tax=Canavalia gladiata TaxID=3824 RepID=A0AAN9QQT7_CANGL